MKKVLIVGAGVAGSDVVREINRSRSTGLSVVGFIDDDAERWGKLVAGVKVLGGKGDLERLVKGEVIDEVIIAIPSAQGEEIRAYVNICSKLKVSFKIVPRVREIIEGRAHLEAVRKVEVEDLLGRPVIKTDIGELKKFVGGKVVLITGAAGSIGSEISRQVAAYGPKGLVMFDWWENGMFELQSEIRENFPALSMSFVIGNIQDVKKVRRLMTKFQPDYVFHAAAYKHVPLMEAHPDEAVRNNVLGTLNLAQAAKEAGVNKFVIISTDKAANPVNVMGATKLITEGIGKMLDGDGTKFMAVRFGNVLGSLGSVVPIFKKQIAKGGPVTITDARMTRFFMTIPEAVQLILKAADMGQGGELFVLDMGKPVRILDLAETMIRLSGLVPGQDIEIKYTGVRDGEKISEEIFTDKEKLVTTQDGEIYISKSMGLDMQDLAQFIEELGKVAEEGDSTKIRAELRKKIPSLR